VNIRRQGHGHHRSKPAKNFGGFNIGDGKTKQAAAHLFELPYPFNYLFPGGTLKIRKRKRVLPHGLDNHGEITSNIDSLDMIKTAYPHYIGNSGLHRRLYNDHEEYQPQKSGKVHKGKKIVLSPPAAFLINRVKRPSLRLCGYHIHRPVNGLKG
jgi:hypothetical protein